MAIVVLIMFYNTAMNSVTSLVIFWRAFVLDPPGGAMISFEQITNWAVVMKTAVLVFQSTAGDGMLIYRCWILYHRSLLPVAFSIVLWLGGTACSIAVIFFESTSKTHALVDSTVFYPFSVAFWASTVVLNIITTTLIILPVWRAVHASENFGFGQYGHKNRLKLIMHIILESGLLYTTVAFMTFVTYTVKHNSLYVISCALVPITGIAFNLIIIRTSVAAETATLTTLNDHSTRQPFKLTTLHKKRMNNAEDNHVQILVTKDTTHDLYPGTRVDPIKSSSQEFKTRTELGSEL
ncbi:hypothetical protein J132_08390 [Termitomyces sp. J132]|nr:hypothetical protein J132_08390 [Termitomyces sp. J132]